MAKRQHQEEGLSAPRPDIFADFREAKIDILNKKAQEQGLDPDDAALYELSQVRGWEVLKGYIRSLKGELRELIDKAIESGASFEDIGKMTMIAKETEAKLDSVITRVDASKEYIETKRK